MSIRNYLFVSLFCMLLLTITHGTLAADSGLVGWWKFDEGSGTVAGDSSRNGHTGALVGPEWLAGGWDQKGYCLEFLFADNENDLVDLGFMDVIGEGITITAWINPHSFSQHDARVISKSSTGATADGHWWMLGTNNEVNVRFRLKTDESNTTLTLIDTPGVLVTNQWQFITARWDGTIASTYVNTVETGSAAKGGTAVATDPSVPVAIGNQPASAGDGPRAWDGLIDDVRVYNRALTMLELQEVMMGFGPGANTELASAPVPADGQTDVPRDVALGWTAGEFAQTHDLYFGTASEDVNNADRSNPLDVFLSQGQTMTTYQLPTLLKFGQTYYWRIDEVNAAPDNTIYKGQLWSFTAEPYAYPIENLTATSNTTSTEGQGPENTVNGSGLNENDQHSTETNAMWAGSPTLGEPPYIQFEFDRVYKLHEMLVWNYNMDFEAFLGFGVKNATIEFSQDGIDWTILSDVELAQGPGSPTYTYNTVIPFDGVAARYVRMNIASSWGAAATVHGLSEVRFSYIPVLAREPQPADGSMDIEPDVILSWRPGRNAISHEVHLSTDEQTVIDGQTPVVTTMQSRYDPAGLNYGATYYWKIVEVNQAETVSTWEGDLWTFSTQKYLVLEDFESYDDDIEAGTTIWQSWVDGIDDSSNGGATVGYAQSPFAEMEIVRTGHQAMPLFYENGNASAISEADHTFTPTQNWTVSGLKSLSIWFHGAEGNTGRLYVKINNVKVTYEGDAGDIAIPAWQPWNIDFSAVGTNLANVTMLTIGVEGTGSGAVYIDDIRLYPKAAEFVNQVAYLALDGNADDSSGSGNNGVENGGLVYDLGLVGQAVHLDGIEDYIVIANTGVSAGTPRTVSGWAKADTTDVVAWTNVFGFTGPSGNNGHFDIECVGSGDYTTLGYYGFHRYGWERDIIPIDLEWHQLAATYDGVTVAWYGDGQLIGSEAIAPTDIAPPGQVHIGKRQDNTNYFAGSVDEVRIYDRALSAEELAEL